MESSQVFSSVRVLSLDGILPGRLTYTTLTSKFHEETSSV